MFRIILVTALNCQSNNYAAEETKALPQQVGLILVHRQIAYFINNKHPLRLEPETVTPRLHAIVEQTGADELMLTVLMHDHNARLRSFEIAAQLQGRE